MKYLLLILFLFTFGCKNEYEDKYNSIKYGDKFTVNDDFYGKFNCTANRKFTDYFFVITYYVEGECSNEKTYIDRIVYPIQYVRFKESK